MFWLKCLWWRVKDFFDMWSIRRASKRELKNLNYPSNSMKYPYGTKHDLEILLKCLGSTRMAERLYKKEKVTIVTDKETK